MASSFKFARSMSFRAVIYPSEFDRSYFTAHCLELDVIGQDRNVEGALAQLLKAIESQLSACVEHGAQLEFWAPGIVWYKYKQGKKVPDELMDRVIGNANKRLGYKSPVNIDMIAGTREVMDEWPAVVT